MQEAAAVLHVDLADLRGTDVTESEKQSIGKNAPHASLQRRRRPFTVGPLASSRALAVDVADANGGLRCVCKRSISIKAVLLAISWSARASSRYTRAGNEVTEALHALGM